MPMLPNLSSGPLPPEKPNALRVFFERGYYDHIDPDPDSFVDIPLSGLLTPPPIDLRAHFPKTVGGFSPRENRPVILLKSHDNPTRAFHERGGDFPMGSVMLELDGRPWDAAQIRWVKEREEWVIIGYECRALSFEDHVEWYSGPWQIDEASSRIILEAYNKPADAVLLEVLRRTPPETLRINIGLPESP